MRLYFRHAKAVYRNVTQVLEQTASSRSNLVRSFRRWRSRNVSDEFSVVDRRVYIQQSAGARDPEVVLRLFVFVARQGVKLAMETERRLNNARRALHDSMPQDGRLWTHLRELFIQPHAADALRSMHALHLLAMAIPEFDAIDSLVLRDLYHRYTVDEHTLVTLQNLWGLRNESEGPSRSFRDLFAEVKDPAPPGTF